MDTKLIGLRFHFLRNRRKSKFFPKSDPANGKVLYPLAPIFACGIQSRFFPGQNFSADAIKIGLLLPAYPANLADIRKPHQKTKTREDVSVPAGLFRASLFILFTLYQFPGVCFFLFFLCHLCNGNSGKGQQECYHRRHIVKDCPWNPCTRGNS